MKVFKQRQKGFLTNLTKVINTAEISLGENPEINVTAVLKKNVEQAILKLQEILEDTFFHASGEEVIKAKQLFNENSERQHLVILRCKNS